MTPGDSPVKRLVLVMLGMMSLFAMVSVSWAGPGPPHLVYERKLNPKRLGVYYRVMSGITRGTPMKGEIYVPTQPLNLKPDTHRIPMGWKWAP